MAVPLTLSQPCLYPSVGFSGAASSVYTYFQDILDGKKGANDSAPFRYLQAQCIVVNGDFHAEMALLLGPYCAMYKLAKMKSEIRILCERSIFWGVFVPRT